ncbi:hypothetical protein PV325_007285 [Microctonus aethiopoides]|nr:hypothetical protein PV325_007285 [Microctonus aethiopoides]
MATKRSGTDGKLQPHYEQHYHQNKSKGSSEVERKFPTRFCPVLEKKIFFIPNVQLKKVQKRGFFLCFGKSTVSLLILGGMLRFRENSSVQYIPKDPVNFQIDRLDGFSGPIDQNLEKIIKEQGFRT